VVRQGGRVDLEQQPLLDHEQGEHLNQAAAQGSRHPRVLLHGAGSVVDDDLGDFDVLESLVVTDRVIRDRP
jgi:hypothetical protein